METNMDKKILVAYATYYGTTGEVAKAIGMTFSEHGYSTDVLPAAEVKDVTAYRAVVVGSAVQGGKIHNDVLHFLEDHEADLSQVPVAYFVCCMTMHDDTPDTRYMAEGYLAEGFKKGAKKKTIKIVDFFWGF